MKITKSELKQIVKECLVEIFSESLTNRPVIHSAPAQQTPIRRKVQEDYMRMGEIKVKTGDAVLDDILKDTARTTLPSMMEAEGKKQPSSSDPFSRIVESSTPEQIFGNDAASKWATLAFADPTKKS